MWGACPPGEESPGTRILRPLLPRYYGWTSTINILINYFKPFRCCLKVHGFEIFGFRFFYDSFSLRALIARLPQFIIFKKICGDIHVLRFITSVKDSGHKLNACVSDSCHKFITGVSDTYHKFMTGDKTMVTNLGSLSL